MRRINRCLLVLWAAAAAPSFAQPVDCPGVVLGEQSRSAVVARFGQPMDEQVSGPNCASRDASLLYIQPPACRPLNEVAAIGAATVLLETDKVVGFTFLYPYSESRQERVLGALAAAYKPLQDPGLARTLGGASTEVVGVFDAGNTLVWVTKPAVMGETGPPYLQVAFAVRVYASVLNRDLNRCR